MTTPARSFTRQQVPDEPPYNWTCGSCFYFGQVSETCHHSPPVRLPRTFAPSATPENRVRDERILWGWPKVAEFDWCGAWRTKP